MDSRNNCGKLELSLKWNNFTENIVSCLESSYGDQDFVDVTLACEGGSIKAHRLILSASSVYLRNVLKENPCPHPVIILKGIAFAELQALLLYIYHGEVRISEQDIPRLLDVAKFLEIRGLSTVQEEAQEKKQLTSNEPPDKLNNNSHFMSSELRSILLDNQVTDSQRKQCKQIPRLQSILQTEVSPANVNTQPDNVSITFNSNYENNQEPDHLMITNNIKEEVDDFSNDSMQFEVDNTENTNCNEIRYTQSCKSETMPAHWERHNHKEIDQSNEGKTYSYQNHKLAFYEPRPCPKCNRMYRDAATLRTHTALMHEILPQNITCSCGATFLTKYDMYCHRRRGHK